MNKNKLRKYLRVFYNISQSVSEICRSLTMELKICCLITEIRKLYELCYISIYTKQTKKCRKSNQSATQDLDNKLKKKNQIRVGQF